MIPRDDWTVAVAGTLVLCSACADVGPEAERRPLQFETLAIPAEVAAGKDVEIDTSYLVGPDGCWGVETFDVEIDGEVIRIEGNAVKPARRDGGCADAVVYARQWVQVFSPPAGRYVVKAGGLTDTLEVIDGGVTQGVRFTYAGPVHADSNGCDTEGNSTIWVALINLPRGTAVGVNHLVRGDVVDSDPCGYPDGPDFDYIVRVREVIPLGE